MASALSSSTVVIECPKCGTRYQLTPEALGPRGRKVSCAHCGETWLASRSVPSAHSANSLGALAQAPTANRPTAERQASVNAPDAAADPDALFDAAAEAALDEALAAEERAVAESAPTDATEAARLKTIADI